MTREPIKYKSLDPGCVLGIHPLSGDFTEERLISSARRQRRPSAGLVVETTQKFSPGTIVIMDLAFEREVKYRSRGMVSRFVEGKGPSSLNKIGVMIFSMDKLDPEGLPFERDTQAAPPPQPKSRPGNTPTGMPSPVDTLPAESAPPPSIDIAIDDFPEQFQNTTVAESQPPTMRETEAAPIESTEQVIPFAANTRRPSIHPHKAQNSMGNRWELLTLCSKAIKSADWIRAPHFKHPATDGIKTDAFSIHHTSPGFRRQITDVTLRDPSAESNAVPSALRPSIPPTFIAFRSNLEEADIEINVDSDFDAEGAMISAFDEMHALFSQTDRNGAAAFAVNMARRLITSEAAICYFVSPAQYELVPNVTRPPSEDAWAMKGRSARSGIHGIVVSTGSPVRAIDPSANADYPFDDDGLATRNILIAPIAFEGYFIGALELRNSPREMGFTEGEADVLTYIGTSLAEFIHKSLPDKRSSLPAEPF